MIKIILTGGDSAEYEISLKAKCSFRQLKS